MSIDLLIEKYLTEKSRGIESWSEESIKKFAKTIGKEPTEEGFFDACVQHMSKHFSDKDARGFCARIKDKAYGSTYWRGRGKKESQVKKDVKAKQNIRKFPKK